MIIKINKNKNKKGSSDQWLPSNPLQFPTSTINYPLTTIPPEKSGYLIDFEKGQIVALKAKNLSFSEIGQLLHRFKCTVQSFHNVYQKMGVAKNLPFTGRPKIINTKTCRHLVRESKKAHRLPLSELLKEVAPLASSRRSRELLYQST